MFILYTNRTVYSLKKFIFSLPLANGGGGVAVYLYLAVANEPLPLACRGVGGNERDRYSAPPHFTRHWQKTGAWFDFI